MHCHLTVDLHTGTHSLRGSWEDLAFGEDRRRARKCRVYDRRLRIQGTQMVSVSVESGSFVFFAARPGWTKQIGETMQKLFAICLS